MWHRVASYCVHTLWISSGKEHMVAKAKPFADNSSKLKFMLIRGIVLAYFLPSSSGAAKLAVASSCCRSVFLSSWNSPRSCSTSPCNVLRKSPSSCDNRRNKLHNSSPNPWNCSFDIWTNAYIAAGNQTLRTIATKHCGKCQTWNRSPQRTITQMNQINQPTTNQSVKYLKFALFEIK